MPLSSCQSETLGPTKTTGVGVELWPCLNAQTSLEGKAMGQKLNDILAKAEHVSESTHKKTLSREYSKGGRA
jgi:hypothetical protein